MSEFFFCGMMELPVVNWSESSTNLNSQLDQSMSSSREPREVHHEDAERGAELDAVVAVGDGVHAVEAVAVEAELRGGHGAVYGVCRPGEGGAPSGQALIMRAFASSRRPMSRASIMP